jgi:membrane protease subunit HflC
MNALTKPSGVFIAGCLALWLFFAVCTFEVDQREAAIVTFFGKVTGVEQEPGLHLKNPLAMVTPVPKLMLEYNKPLSNTVTNDKKNILVSFYVKYRIDDPLKFTQTVAVRTEAEKRIDDLVYSELKTAISKTAFDKVVIGRGEIERQTLEAAQDRVRQYGIQLVDFRIKRTDLPPQILDSVYKRMNEERGQKAQMDRSEGDKLKQIATAEADKKATEISSEAYRKKQELMGEGDREALKILETAYGQDVEFAMFLRTLDVYRTSLKATDTRMILSTQNELLKYLKEVEAPK